MQNRNVRLKSLVALELGPCWPTQSSWFSMSSKDTLKKLRYEIFENVMHHIHKIFKDSIKSLWISDMNNWIDMNLRYESPISELAH